MLPEYQGPNLRKVAVTSDIFEGMKFGESSRPFGPPKHTIDSGKVVMSDPKSRTGDQDKKELMKQCVALC